MCQDIRQRTCSRLLLTLLFLLFATNNPTTSTTNNSKKLLTSTQWQFLATSDGYEIQCPPMVQDPQIKIKFTGSSATIICNQFDDEEYQLLPAMNFGEFSSFIMKNCPLPSRSISYFIFYLGLKKLQFLIFENHILSTNITREHLSGLNGLEGIFLNVTDLSLIRESLFDYLPNLQYLAIYASKISLTRKTFAALVNLKYLKLKVRNLQQLPAGIFRNQRMLATLEIDNTPLRNISKNFYELVSSISDLRISFSDIEYFQSDVFALLPNLTNINLSNNNFRELPAGIFAHSKMLKEVLMFNSTSLKALPSGLLANLPNLYSAHITCNPQNSKEDYEKFISNENLVHISCNLDEIPQDLFANSSNIIKISLAKNKLVKLKGILFQNQRSLEFLDLSHNRLKSLSKELFRYTKRLIVLKLSNNYLDVISRDLFSKLIYLAELYLNNNRIVKIDSYAFFKNKRLHSLNLQTNSLRHVPRNYGMVRLQELDLSHNSIAALNYDDLLPYSNNTLSINLTFNRISKINLTSEFLPEVFNKKLFLTVQLNNNPINCDCNLLPFLSRYDVKLKFEISKLYCDKPSNMKNMKLLDVEPKDLLCPINFENFKPLQCPLGCKCWERTYDSVLLIDCSSNNLTEVPELPRVQPLGLERIELHLENNELKELPIVTTSGYADVTRIFAAANQISHIYVNNLPENLIFLDVSHNNFKELNQNVLNLFKRNSSLNIALSENPWNCGCESKNLRQFVAESSKMITDIDKVYCDSPIRTKMFEYFNTNDICQDGQDGLFTWTISISVVCFSIAFTAALYYKYQTEVKIWLYSHSCCLWWVNEEELDKDKRYDAFVSYSSKDDEFVLGQLVPELENGPIRFKLCLHIRDFIVGGIIPDQIICAIADSRRTIVVLSENFIRSVWARMEFRLAHQAGLEEKRTKVIVIVYGEIGNISSLDLELQAYLKMTTYLEWGNPWFWDRLRYTMPHPIRRSKVNTLKLNETSTTQNAIENDG